MAEPRLATHRACYMTRIFSFRDSLCWFMSRLYCVADVSLDANISWECLLKKVVRYSHSINEKGQSGKMLSQGN